MSQLSLVLRDMPLPFKRDSETSRAAATKARPKAPGHRAAILGYLLGRGTIGATNEEISEALGLKIQTVCPRMAELREMKKIVFSGEKRMTQSHSEAKIWVHMEFAQ